MVIDRSATTLADGATSQISWAPGWTPVGIFTSADRKAEIVGDDLGEDDHLRLRVQLDAHHLARLEARAAHGEGALLGDAHIAGTTGTEVDGRRRALLTERRGRTGTCR